MTHSDIAPDTISEMFDPEKIMDHFPPKFKPRDQQREAIQKISKALVSGKRVVLLELPTGGGKSFITQTFARAVRQKRGKTHFLTIQKILQDQYERDFPAPEIELLKGRSNYDCNHSESNGSNCADAPCTWEKKGILPECITGGSKPSEVTSFTVDPESVLCPYWKQLLKCDRNPITLFNFSSFLFQQRIGRFGHRNLMVVDEAHNIEGQLMNFVELVLREKDLELIDVELKGEFKTGEDVEKFIRKTEILSKISDKLDDHRKQKTNSYLSEDIAADLSRAEHEALKNLRMKIENFLRFLEKTTWIVEKEISEFRGRSQRRLRCRPLFVKDFAEDLLFSKAKQIIAVSATILSKKVWAENLGLKLDEVEFIQMGTDFPKKNRPIRLEYVGSMNYKYKQQTLPKLIRWIDQVLLPRHKGERGIIHCHSFDILNAIRKGVHSDRLLFHERGQDKKEILAAHSERTDSVIVAPAFHEGVDLKDNLSRFQVIAKVPYPSTKDRVISQRMAMNGEWYGWVTALKCVQSYGRSVRSKTDKAVTYITDEGFSMFRRRNGKLLPPWFKEALVKV